MLMRTNADAEKNREESSRKGAVGGVADDKSLERPNIDTAIPMKPDAWNAVRVQIACRNIPARADRAQMEYMTSENFASRATVCVSSATSGSSDPPNKPSQMVLENDAWLYATKLKANQETQAPSSACQCVRRSAITVRA
mmetsp:Transcript_10826/g.28630  ORF Transcript_10826/g.28630 Transcript_10826/m.28630 type:complete len:140 (+) Transcript_10826:194-613(+)